MVTINYEPLEHLPHIDENISPEERSHVEQLIRLELANQFNNNIQHITHNDEIMANPNIIVEQQQQQQEQQQLLVPTPMHPLVDQLLPLNPNIQPTSIMQLTQERFEEEFGDDDDDDDGDDKHLPPGIDLTKYTQFNITSPLDEEGNQSILDDNNNQQINYTNLYTTLGHSALQHRNLELLIRNQIDLNQLQQQDLARLDELNTELTKNINNKRSMVDELKTNRKRRQLNELKPLQEEYEERWKQSINTAIESSINSINQK